MDLADTYAGTVSGFMNMGGNLGGAISLPSLHTSRNVTVGKLRSMLPQPWPLWDCFAGSECIPNER